MAYNLEQQINTGSFIPTTFILDVARLHEVNVNSAEFKELLVRLYQTINSIVLALNTKATGYYINEEFVNGKLYFNPNSTDPLQLRPGFQKTINTGALGAGVTAINHGITVTNTFKWMFISGAATNTSTLVGYPITFAGASGNNIEVTTSATQVLINNNSGVTFTDSQVTLEYVKF
jgi:hypothetical protein